MLHFVNSSDVIQEKQIFDLEWPWMTLTLTLTWNFQNGKHFIFDLYCLESFCTKRSCFYAPNCVFWPLWPFLKIKRALKVPSKGIFFKSLKLPHNGVIKTLCAKNEVCKSISMTCSTYRRVTKNKEENTRKWPKKGPQRAKNPNFEKQKIAFFSHVPRSTMPKN